MHLILELPEESIAQLKRQALNQGVTLEAWVQALSGEKATDESIRREGKARAAAAQILEIQSRVKPDPSGWTTREYIDHSRR